MSPRPATGRRNTRHAASRLAAAACIALASCAPAHDAEQLLYDLESPDVEIRQDATEAIARVLKSGDYEVFLRGARTLKRQARVQSILYLARFQGAKAAAALRSLLREEDRALIPWNPIRMKPQSELTDSRILVAHLIAEKGGDPEAAVVLLDGADRQEAEVFIGTVYALGALRDPRAVPLLAGASRHADPEIARSAVESLGRIRIPEAFEALAAAANHPAEQVRIDVLSSLSMRSEPEVVDLVRALAMGDPVPEIRAAAIHQLSRYRQPAVVAFLIEQLGAADAAPRQAAHETLIQMTGQSLRPDRQTWARWWARNEATFKPAS